MLKNELVPIAPLGTCSLFHFARHQIFAFANKSYTSHSFIYIVNTFETIPLFLHICKTQYSYRVDKPTCNLDNVLLRLGWYKGHKRQTYNDSFIEKQQPKLNQSDMWGHIRNVEGI